MPKQIAFLFGGAWGNVDPGITERWFDHLVRRLEAQGWTVIPVPYEGWTLERVVRNAGEFALQHRNGGLCIGVSYSMGGNVMHAVAERHPTLFHELVFVSSPEPQGFDWASFLWAFRILWAPFLLSVLTLGAVPIYLTPWSRAQRFFANKDGFPDPSMDTFVRNHRLWIHPQAFWPATQVALPLLRRKCKGLTVPCIYVIPKWDRVARVPHACANLQGNTVVHLGGPWGHGAILQESAVEQMWGFIGPRLARHFTH